MGSTRGYSAWGCEEVDACGKGARDAGLGRVTGTADCSRWSHTDFSDPSTRLASWHSSELPGAADAKSSRRGGERPRGTEPQREPRCAGLNASRTYLDLDAGKLRLGYAGKRARTGSTLSWGSGGGGGRSSTDPAAQSRRTPLARRRGRRAGTRQSRAAERPPTCPTPSTPSPPHPHSASSRGRLDAPPPHSGVFLFFENSGRWARKFGKLSPLTHVCRPAPERVPVLGPKVCTLRHSLAECQTTSFSRTRFARGCASAKREVSWLGMLRSHIAALPEAH